MNDSYNTPELKAAQLSHEGMSGKHNEDSCGFFALPVDDGETLYIGVVADGIGGQQAGEMASRLAVEAIEDYFKNLKQFNNLSGHLERAVLRANREVYQHSQDNPDLQGMGTTMVIAAIWQGRLYMAHVGDSRIYLLRDGRLRQLTIDHTWAQEAIEAGLLTREEAKTHPNRNVIKRFLGGATDVEVDHRLYLTRDEPAETARRNQGHTLQPGDTLLLCSDGLSDMIDDGAILSSLKRHYDDLPAASQELIDKANAAGGRDNITVVLMQLPGGQPKMAAAPAAAPARRKRAAAGQTAKWGVPLLLAAGGVGTLLLLLVVAAFFLLNQDNDNGLPADGTLTLSPQTEEIDPAIEEGPPATAAVLPSGREEDDPVPPPTDEGEDGDDPTTPVLIPTLRPTSTPTPIPPTNTPRPTATPTATATPTPLPQLPGDDTGPPPPPPPPPPTDPPPPTPER